MYGHGKRLLSWSIVDKIATCAAGTPTIGSLLPTEQEAAVEKPILQLQSVCTQVMQESSTTLVRFCEVAGSRCGGML